MKNISVHFIINEMYSKDGIITDVSNAIQAGVTVVQYNEKKLRKRQIVENAYILSALCKKNNVLFFIRDYPDVAALVDADGVHLTQPDFSIPHVRRMLSEEKVIGVDFQSLRHAVYAEEAGVDYISIPLINTQRSTFSRLKKLKEIITIPIIGMGDISSESMEDLIDQGIDGIALMSHSDQGNELLTSIKKMLSLVHQPQYL